MVFNVSFIVFLEELHMESPKGPTKQAKLQSKIYFEVKNQAISFKIQEKTQNSRIKLKNSASH